MIDSVEPSPLNLVWVPRFDPKSNIIDLSDIKWKRTFREAGLMQLSSGAWVTPESRGYKLDLKLNLNKREDLETWRRLNNGE